MNKAKNLVQIISYSLVDKNLYIVSGLCCETLRQRIERLQSHQVKDQTKICDQDDYVDTGDALKALITTDRFKTYVVLVLIHDCLKILKMLALYRPNDAICFTVDNLLIKDGHVILSDAYLSKAKLKREI